MKLYDDCLIFILKKNICTDALPSTVQNDIFVLRNLYQIKRQYAEKAEILEYWAFSHSLWWEDKLENIGTVCLDCDDGFLECYEGCLECYEWSEIEKEKKRGDVALEKMSEELAKLRVLGHNPETHNPEYPQPGKTQPGKLQPGRDTT